MRNKTRKTKGLNFTLNQPSWWRNDAPREQISNHMERTLPNWVDKPLGFCALLDFGKNPILTRTVLLLRTQD